MATLLGRTFKSASVDDQRSRTIEYSYECESLSDLESLISALPLKGAPVTTIKQWITLPNIGRVPWIYELWYIDSYSIDRVGTRPGGKIHVTCTEQSHMAGSLKKTVILPEDLPPYNFRMSSQLQDETFNQYYPGDESLYTFPRDNGVYVSGAASDTPAPLTNTAGSWIEGSRTITTSTISFSYNRESVNFDGIYTCVGCVNSTDVTICGMNFLPRTVRIEQIDVEGVHETYDLGTDLIRYQDNDGSIKTMKGKGTWSYYRLNVSLSVKPESYNTTFANSGTHFLRNGRLAHIWRWSDPIYGTAKYGTCLEYQNSQSFDGEAITDPVFLNEAGTDVQGTDSTLRQIPTYIYGCPYRPIDFNELDLPSSEPLCWELGDDEKSSTGDVQTSDV